MSAAPTAEILPPQDAVVLGFLRAEDGAFTLIAGPVVLRLTPQDARAFAAHVGEAIGTGFARTKTRAA